MGNIWMLAAGSFGTGFLLGSIPWGVIISKLFYRTDIREQGSGNIGTANAMRTMGFTGGVAVLALDLLKGLAAGGIALLFAVIAAFDASQAALIPAAEAGGSIDFFGIVVSDSASLALLNKRVFGLVQGLGLLGCVSGHVFSPWLRFKGGKGVAVAAGSMFFGFGWQGLLVLVLVFVSLIAVTRFVSVGSLTAALAAPPVAFWVSGGEPVFIVLVCVTAGLVAWAHRGNISRLRSGTERRIGAKKEEAA